LIVVCGEALIDLVPADGDLWRALPGGSPANTAVALARLSTPTSMLARISGDAFGVQLRSWLSANDVGLRYLVDATEPTTLAIVSVDNCGVARYTFHIHGTADWGWRSGELPTSFSTDVRAIHAGSMALIGAPVLETLLARERSERVISIDPNVRPVMCPDAAQYRSSVERWLSLAHIVKASVDDVAWLYPHRSCEDVLADWAGRGPAVVVLTLGPDGAVARTSGGATVKAPGVSVDVVDTIAAGDTFSAALLHALDSAGCLDPTFLTQSSTESLEAVLRFAVRASAVACTRAGADPPYLRDLG
jgi:fructokinase